MSSAGELRFVDDPLLLTEIAQVYDQVNHCVLLEGKILDVIHYPGVRMVQEKGVQHKLLEYLVETDPILIEKLLNVLVTIELEIQRLPSASS